MGWGNFYGSFIEMELVDLRVFRIWIFLYFKMLYWFVIRLEF